MPAYTHLLFRGILRSVPTAPQAAGGLRLLERLSDLDGPCRRRYVEGPYPIGTGPSPDGPRCPPDSKRVP